MADALKNATFEIIDPESTEPSKKVKAFYSITLESITPSEGSGGDESFFAMRGVFHRDLFNFKHENVSLKVPSITSSPSVKDIFSEDAALPQNQPGGGN